MQMYMYVGLGVIVARCRWVDLFDSLLWCQRDYVNNIFIYMQVYVDLYR